MNGGERSTYLAQRLVDDVITDAERRELEQLLKDNEEARLSYLRELRMHAALTVALGKRIALPDAGTRPTFATHADSRPRLRLRWLAPLAIAASLALVVGGWWLAQSRQPAGLGLRVVEVAGEANIQHSTSNIQHPSGEGKQVKAVVGMELRQGDRVVVAAGGKIGLKYDREETTIGLEGATAGFGAEMGGKRVKLEAGRFVCTAAPQAKPFRIQSPHALSTVVGTRFNIEVFDAKTALAVSEGMVEFDRDGKILKVGPGQSAEASDQGLKMVAPKQEPVVPPATPNTVRTNGVGRVIREIPLFDMVHRMTYDVAFDGKALWVIEAWNRNPSTGVDAGCVLSKFDSMTGAQVEKVDVRLPEKDSSVVGLAWDGVSVWLAKPESRKLYAVNPTTGLSIKMLNLPSDFVVHGLAAGDGYLWVSGFSGQVPNFVWKVLKMDPSSGTVLSSWPIPAGIGMIAHPAGRQEYCNGAIWMAANDQDGKGQHRVWKLNPADGSVLGSFAVRLPDKGRIQDLAASGTAGQMWVATRYGAYLVEMGEGAGIEN